MLPRFFMGKTNLLYALKFLPIKSYTYFANIRRKA